MAYCNVATDVFHKWLINAVEFFYKHLDGHISLDGHYWLAIDVYKPVVPKNGVAVRLNIREWLCFFTASKAWTGCKNSHQRGQHQNKDNQTWRSTSCPLRIVSRENLQILVCPMELSFLCWEAILKNLFKTMNLVTQWKKYQIICMLHF